MLASQREVVAKLKDGLAVMKDKLGQHKVKRDQLKARAKTAQAQAQVQQAIGSMNVLDPTSEISRNEDQIRRQDALVAGRAEGNASSLDSPFAVLESGADSLGEAAQ